MFKELKLKNRGDYHDLYVQSDTLSLADVLENFRNKCIEIYELDPAHFVSAPGLVWQACLKKTRVRLELLTDIDMLLIVEKGIRGGICHSIQPNNKYMKHYDKDMASSYLEYLDASNLYGRTMPQKLLVNCFKWVEELSQFKEDFTGNYDEDSNKGYFLEVDVEYPKILFTLHSDLPFLPERNKIKQCNQLVCNVHDKKNYVVHIKALKQALNHGLILKKVHRIIQFNQKAWLKSYIDINTKLRKEAKNEFVKYFFKLMNNAVLGKTVGNVRKHRDIRLVKTDKRRNQFVSEPSYHKVKCFSENLMAIETKKTKVKMNKSVYLCLSILDISKTLMYEFWYDCIKPENKDNAKLCYMDTDSFVIHVKTEDFMKTLLMMLKDG